MQHIIRTQKDKQPQTRTDQEQQGKRKTAAAKQTTVKALHSDLKQNTHANLVTSLVRQM